MAETQTFGHPSIVAALITAACVMVSAAQAPPPSAVVSPAPNDAGWHSAPVTVAFPCLGGGRDCRPEVVFDRDGAGQRLDLPASPRSTPERIVINLDRTAPTVTLDTPSDGLRTTAAHLDVSGRASDGLSGLRWAACNGVRAVVDAGRVRCRVPLEVGTNAVIVHAMDNAGNSASAAIRVIRLDQTGVLSIVTTRTTTSADNGYGGLFQAVSSAGTPEADLEWAVAPSGLVDLEGEGAVRFARPTAPGRATIRAQARGIMAAASITVLEGPDIPSGVTAWAVEPLPGQVHHRWLSTAYGNELNVSAALVTSRGHGRSAIRALSMIRGGAYEVWRGVVDGEPLAIDVRGGVLARIERPDAHALVRYDAIGADAVWRFDAEHALGDVERDEKGRIYVVEAGTDDRGRAIEARIAILDGTTGLATTRVPLPSSTLIERRCDGTTTAQPLQAEVATVFGGTDSVVTTVVVEDVTYAHGCRGTTRVPGQGRLAIQRRLDVIDVDDEGVTPLTTIWRWQGDGPDTLDWLRHAADIRTGPVVPIDKSTLLAFWRQAGGGAGVLHMTTLTEHGQHDVTPIPAAGEWQSALLEVFDAPRVFLADAGAFHSVDLDSGRARWTLQRAVEPVFALDGVRDRPGPVMVKDVATQQLLKIDDDGAVVASQPFPVDQARIVIRDNDIIHGLETGTSAFVEHTIPPDTLAGAYAVLDIRTPASPSPRLTALEKLVR